MTNIEAIKDGFRLINRNWQLVFVQLGMVIISSLGFFIIVGIPLAVAFIIFGIDLTGLAHLKDIFGILREPSDIISRYLGLFLIIIASFLIYITLIALFGIYVFGGSVGILGRSLRDRTLSFSMHAFFDEAQKLFSRLFGFTAVIGILVIAVAFILGILGGSIAALISFARSQDSTLALFFGTFFSMILVIIGLALILGIISITLYGIACLFFKGTGSIKSIREAIHYLFRHPNAFWLYTILCIGYILASFLLILLSSPFTLIPVVGVIFSFPYQLISYVFQTYLGLAIIAAILSYYYSTEIVPEPFEGPTTQAPV